MEVKKTREMEHKLEYCGDGCSVSGGDDDDCGRQTTTIQVSSARCGNGIEHLEMVQEIPRKLANCHLTQHQEEKNNNGENKMEMNNDVIEGEESKLDRDSLEREIVGSSKSVQNHSALAFTIDFGDNRNAVEPSRYQNLFQRYNARHKRNLSTSKIEIKEKPIGAADLSPNFIQKYKPLSIHSEGYFSGEDDTKRRADRLSQKLKELGLKTNSKGAMKMSKPDNSTHDDEKRRSYHEESTNNCATTSPSSQMTYSSTLNDLSKIQNNVEEDRNRVQNSPEKKYTKNIEYIEMNHDDYVDETTVEESSLDITEKLSNMSYLSDNCPSLDGFASGSSKYMNVVQTMSVSYTGESTNCTDIDKTNLDIFNVSNIDASSDGAASEAGTYTIHKDYTDEEKARMDIDKVFSVGVLQDEENNELYVHHFKMQSSRDTNTWISEWATQVAEHNSLPSTIGIGGPMGRPPPLSPTKIPSPVYSRTPLRNTRNHYEQSDSSLDTDIQQKRDKINSLTHQHTLIDSGGESDDDTSNSYNTPPHSSQRTPTHSTLIRRGSLSEALFKRANNNDCRRSMRKYSDVKKNDDVIFNVPKSPSHALARLHLERGCSLDRKSDTAESNSSRRSSLKNYPDENFKHTNSPILNRLRSTTPKLTNSPILNHKSVNMQTRIINLPSFERQRQLIKSTSQTKNIGYYTCVENSPYMLKKSNSTSNYREDTTFGVKELSVIDNNSKLHHNVGIQRSTSNTSIRNTKVKNLLSRRSSFNDHQGGEKMPKGKMIVSDSSSETGEIQNSVQPPISSGIKLNRTFSIRRARVGCGDSDTTPNSTPEERRRKAQNETKSAPSSARQSSHYRARTSSVGAGNKESKKPEALRSRVPSLSRNESGRYSMRAQKISSPGAQSTRPNSKANNNSREIKNSGRSNSTLTSKEVEFQNWKRRKNYDPMKAAAQGKKKLDNSRKNHSTEDNCTSRDNSVLRSASFHGTRGTLSLADNDWSENEEQNFIESREIIQVPPPCSPLGSDSDLDTSSYLQTTQNVMSAMSARITVYQTPAVDSGGESDEDTSHSLRQIHKTHEPSDTETSDEAQVLLAPPPPPLQSSTGIKFMRLLGSRRGRDNQEIKLSPKNKLPPASSRQKSDTTLNSIARTDSGRFSMRMARGPSSTNAGLKSKSKEIKKQSGISSREQEMQNWKRRKSYDPMKAAMEGKKKAEMTKKNFNSESSSVLRSQSFHGQVNNLGINEWSDEDVSASADEAPIY